MSIGPTPSSRLSQRLENSWPNRAARGSAFFCRWFPPLLHSFWCAIGGCRWKSMDGERASLEFDFPYETRDTELDARDFGCIRPSRICVREQSPWLRSRNSLEAGHVTARYPPVDRPAYFEVGDPFPEFGTRSPPECREIFALDQARLRQRKEKREAEGERGKPSDGSMAEGERNEIRESLSNAAAAAQLWLTILPGQLRVLPSTPRRRRRFSLLTGEPSAPLFYLLPTHHCLRRSFSTR